MGTRSNYTPTRPSIRHIPTKPPAIRGKVTNVKISNGNRNWGRK